MTVWTLARSGQHQLLRLGQPLSEIVELYGEPAATADRNVLVRYEDVELYFTDNALWLIHCEFGSPPLPPAVASESLRLRPDGLTWPTSRLALVKMVRHHGFELEISTESSAECLRFGLARLVIHANDELVSWSVMQPNG